MWYEEEYFIVCKKLNENIEECDKITLVLTRGDRGNNADSHQLVYKGNIRQNIDK